MVFVVGGINEKVGAKEGVKVDDGEDDRDDGSSFEEVDNMISPYAEEDVREGETEAEENLRGSWF